MNSGLFFLCACSETDRGGIRLCRMESDVSAPVELALTPLPGTNFLSFSRDGKTLYATANTKEEGGSAAAFRCGPDGSLQLLSRVSAEGVSSCYVSCSPDGRYLYTANYSSGSVTEFELAEDGSIVRRIRVIEHRGPCGPVRDRQEKPHTHCTVFTPDGKYLCVNDLGMDSILLYPVTPDGLALPAAEWKAEPGEGPRHILFDKSGSYAYVVNELASSVTALRYSDGKLERLGSWSALPPDCPVKTKAAAIRFSPDGRYLFATNRGFDSVACFRIVSPGVLELADIVSSRGSSPRDFQFLPGGKIAAAANEFSDQVCLFDYEAGSGTLRYREGADLTDLPRPLYIAF
ncbi:MAG: lactonase family protein [Lentisphaeria bacterium]|nr:lactonase family protein [Lentisphaeria bacterium]